MNHTAFSENELSAVDISNLQDPIAHERKLETECRVRKGKMAYYPISGRVVDLVPACLPLLLQHKTVPYDTPFEDSMENAAAATAKHFTASEESTSSFRSRAHYTEGLCKKT